jgi:hypothetical protein
MMTLKSSAATDVAERSAFCIPGMLPLLVGLAVLAWLAVGIVHQVGSGAIEPPFPRILAAIVTVFVVFKGLVILEPRQAVVLTFFGKYAGTIRRDGFWWFNPLCVRHKISLRVVNMTTPTIKVNDLSGNPIEVAAVVVWRVEDTARAAFAVENYAGFIAQQAESSLRQVASIHPYDSDDRTQSLRGNVESVSEQLKDTIGTHVQIAGVEILDARLAHLAYAPEIAGVMLRRQQAQAVLAARRIIVEGTVSLVQLAIEDLHAKNVVQLTDSQRAMLVTNLMTVLVADNEVSPVVPMSAAAA